MSYCRKKAEEIIVYDCKKDVEKLRTKQLKFKEDTIVDLIPDDKFPGFATGRVVLFAGTPNEELNINRDDDTAAATKDMDDWVLKT